MSALNKLTSTLLTEIAKQHSNVVISPSCLYQALAISSEITSGNTKNEIISALGCEKEINKTVDLIAKIEVPKFYYKMFHYSTGASIWLDKRIRTNANFTKQENTIIPNEIKCVSMGTEKTSIEMGKWLSENTGGIYSDAPRIDPDTLMVVMSAMHLKDAWANDFEEDFPRPFKLFDGTIQNTNFMLDWDDYSYLERNGSITLSKKLMSNCSMCISMPGEEISVQEYIKNGSAWKNILDYTSNECTEVSQECKLYMPKFNLSSDDIEMTELIQSLGIEEIFRPNANFSPISTDSLAVNSILQSTQLKVDEQGLEGASYVVVAACAGACPENLPIPKEIIIDRPFVIAVFSPDAIPLFIGVVMTPEENTCPSQEENE